MNKGKSFCGELSQADKMYLYMKGGGRLTALAALRVFGCMRLAARILDMEREGAIISRRFIILGNGKKVMEYYIE